MGKKYLERRFNKPSLKKIQKGILTNQSFSKTGSGKFIAYALERYQELLYVWIIEWNIKL